jgi:hypothetical protein
MTLLLAANGRPSPGKTLFGLHWRELRIDVVEYGNGRVRRQRPYFHNDHGWIWSHQEPDRNHARNAGGGTQAGKSLHVDRLLDANTF